MRQLAHVKVSIRLDVVFAHDRTPQSHLFADEFPKLFRAAQRERHLLCLIELLGDARVAQGRGKLVGEPADDRLGRACLALGDRRHIRERRGPGLAGFCQRSDRAGLNERNGLRCAGDEQINMPGDEIVHGGAAAAIGYQKSSYMPPLATSSGFPAGSKVFGSTRTRVNCFCPVVV